MSKNEEPDKVRDILINTDDPERANRSIWYGLNGVDIVFTEWIINALKSFDDLNNNKKEK